MNKQDLTPLQMVILTGEPAFPEGLLPGKQTD